MKRRLFVAAATLAALWMITLPAPSLGQAKEREGSGTAQKSQAELAAKTDFATVAASDAAVTKAAEARDLAAVRKLLGKEGAFQGTVARVFTSEGSGILILHFHQNAREAVTAVLKPPAYAKFPDMKTLQGKRVLVRGRFAEFRGQVEVELTEPGQVKIVR